MQENDKKPKVTVIAAIYKSEPFLDKLILSIINQDYRNIEIILVDDGSPDGSGAVCDKYALQDSRIIVIHKENGGVCDARNVAMEKSTGEYVCFVDGDDWLEKDYVSYLMMLIQTTNSDMAMTDKIFTTRDRNQICEDKIEIFSSEKAAAVLLYPVITIGPWNKIYSMRMLKEKQLVFLGQMSGEGLEFSVTAAQYANHVAVGHRKIYSYRLNNTNSALTHYNVQMGLNAYNHIRHLSENLVLNTPVVRNAVNWHIWKNYSYVLFLIIATDSKNENLALYKECTKNLLTRLPSVLVKSKVSFKTKIRMILEAFFPVSMANRRLKREKLGLKNDTME